MSRLGHAGVGEDDVNSYQVCNISASVGCEMKNTYLLTYLLARALYRHLVNLTLHSSVEQLTIIITEYNARHTSSSRPVCMDHT